MMNESAGASCYTIFAHTGLKKSTFNSLSSDESRHVTLQSAASELFNVKNFTSLTSSGDAWHYSSLHGHLRKNYPSNQLLLHWSTFPRC